MSEPRRKHPYVTPRVVQVERRRSGDNLSAGCKVATEAAVGGGGETCQLNASCFNTGS